MSELIVEVVEISAIEKHPNADRLDLATVKGWQCVIQKDAFKVGEKVVYLPIDSVLPPELEEKLFPPDSKVKLHNSRIKTIKLRGAISQGMIIPLSETDLPDSIKLGKDVKDKLGITKFELKTSQPGIMSTKGNKTKKQRNSNFRKYTDIQHAKNYPTIMEGSDVVITEKIHGTNYRVGYVKYSSLNFWNKIKRWLGFGQEYEFVFGSHNVQLQGLLKLLKKQPTFYKKNVYLEAVKQYNLRDCLNENEVIYAEIYGWGIQFNYAYGCKEDERKMVVVDVMIDGKYIDTEDAIQFCQDRNLPYAPVLYKGMYKPELLEEYVTGKSVLAPKQQPIKEGIVITAMHETATYMGRAILKHINPKYLLKDQTEYH